MSEHAIAEQRRAYRCACVLEAVKAGDEAPGYRAWPMRVVNISTLGIGVQAGEPLAVGCVVTVRLRNLAQRWLAPVRMRIVHATEQENGTWIMGAAFARPLSEAEVLELLA